MSQRKIRLFLEEARAEPWLDAYGQKSPLRDGNRQAWVDGTERPTWQPNQTQRCGLVGLKIGVYPMWSVKGHMYTCSVIQVGV